VASLRRTSILLFLLAFAIRVAVVFATDQVHDFSTRKEMARTAIAFATKGELADPFAAPTGPTAHVPPLYPIFLGLLFRIFGTGVAGETVKCLLTCAVSSLRSAFMPSVARALGLDSRVGLTAGLLSALYVPALITEVKGDWEPPYTALALMGLFVLAYRVAKTGQLELRTAAIQGFLWGLALLLTPAIATILAGFLLLQALRFLRREPVRYLQWAAILGVVTVATMSPWAVRNAIQLGSPVLTKDCFGMETFVSNHPGATWSVADEKESEWLDREFPTRQPRAAEELRDMGEIAYNQAKLRVAMDWIRSNPDEFAKLVLQRIFHFWFPVAARVPLTAIFWAFTLTAFAGLYLMRRESPMAAWMIGICWLLFPLVYYLAAWSSRYRYPVEWTLMLAASVAIASALRLVRRPTP
jgi:hypothetical protein